MCNNSLYFFWFKNFIVLSLHLTLGNYPLFFWFNSLALALHTVIYCVCAYLAHVHVCALIYLLILIKVCHVPFPINAYQERKIDKLVYLLCILIQV